MLQDIFYNQYWIDEDEMVDEIEDNGFSVTNLGDNFIEVWKADKTMSYKLVREEEKLYIDFN